MKLFTNSLFPVFHLIICLLVAVGVQAQRRRYVVPGLDTLEQTFIVRGGSSTVLQNGQAEVIWNNSLISHWMAFHQDDKNSPILDRFRRTQFTSDILGYYGISQSGRWDIGLQLKYVRTRLDNAASSSMFKVFRIQSGRWKCGSVL